MRSRSDYPPRPKNSLAATSRYSLSIMTFAKRLSRARNGVKTAAAQVLAVLLALTLGDVNAAAREGKLSFQYSVQISDPDNTFQGKQSQLQANVQGAIEQWKAVLVMKGTLRVLVVPTSDPSVRVEGASVANTLIGTSGGVPVFEEGAAHLIRTGTNLNSSQPDLTITINSSYLHNEIWIDPKPLVRTAPVPSDKVDLVSILTHELGHALGFQGFIDQTTGLTNLKYLSVFDTFITRDAGGSVYFNGPSADAEYGSPVPLSPRNYYHYGTRQTPSLFTSLMNGLVFYYGTRYGISPLDLAILRDLGQTLR